MISPYPHFHPLSPLLALDIGGANIKLADGNGYAASRPFDLWKYPERLAEEITKCLAEAPPADRLAITMTGELCDCFETKSEGVRAIVAASLTAACNRSVFFYQTNGHFVSAEIAIESPLLTAASNWHALASLAATYCEQKPGLLIDIGSTTTDMIPLVAGKVAAQGHTDTERLLHGELVYSGIERSPVCGVVSQLPWRGEMYPVALELFATTADAYLLLGDIAEDAMDNNTADGKPLTIAAAHTRLARMICADRELVLPTETVEFAQAIRAAQIVRMEIALRRVIEAMPAPPQIAVLSGHGEFLAHQLLTRLDFEIQFVSLTKEWGPNLSRCAPAHALALLAKKGVTSP